jgi:hypothetical protein
MENPVEVPWKHMAQTYAWVAEQEQMKLEKKKKKTEKWVIEQQNFLADRSNQRNERDKSPRRRTWEEAMNKYDEIEGEKQRGLEAANRPVAVEREKDKAKAIEKEIRRIQARVQKKKETEMQRMAEEKLRATETQREKEKQERARSNVAPMDAWRAYEAGWASMTASSEPLMFRTIPWPQVSRPSNAEGIIPEGIVAFLLSPLHSQTQTRKDRIRSALLRWHPDRFQKFLAKVVEEDKASVQEGVGIVVRCLNELMERETRASRREILLPFVLCGASLMAALIFNRFGEGQQDMVNRIDGLSFAYDDAYIYYAWSSCRSEVYTVVIIQGKAQQRQRHRRTPDVAK